MGDEYNFSIPKLGFGFQPSSTSSNVEEYLKNNGGLSNYLSKPPSLDFTPSVNTDAVSSSFADTVKSTNGITNKLGGSADTSNKSFLDGIFDDQYKMGNIVGLAGALTNLVALPTMLEGARLANRSARFNLNQAKQDAAFRDTQRANINRVAGPRPSAPVSAFA